MAHEQLPRVRVRVRRFRRLRDIIGRWVNARKAAAAAQKEAANLERARRDAILLWEADHSRLQQNLDELEAEAKETLENLQAVEAELAREQRRSESEEADARRKVDALEHKVAVLEEDLRMSAAIIERTHGLYATETALLAAVRTRVLEHGSLGGGTALPGDE